MKKKTKKSLFAAMFLAVLGVGFAACEKNEPKNPDAEEYTLTVVSSDPLLGTTSGSGKYASGSSVKIVASPIGNAEFVSWSDCNVIDTTRVIKLTSDSTIIASFKESIIWDETPTGYLGTHGYVDLGLPSGTLWATCNVGANKPTEYGNYFAWGEIVTKASYSSSNYNYSANPSVLPASADAATVHWGEGWRMPTTEQLNELYYNTEDIHVNNYNGSGISGLILKSVTNGNHIFFPSNGYYMNEKNISDGYSGYYWASGIADLSGQARRLWFDASTATWDQYSRWAGYGVRPVVGAANTDVVMTCAEAITHLNEAVIVEGYVAFAYDYSNNGVQSAWIADDAATSVGVFQAYNCAVTQSVSKGDRVRVEGTMIQFTKTSGQTIYEIKGGTMTKL